MTAQQRLDFRRMLLASVAFGATIERAPRPVHGRATTVFHDRRGVFEGLSNPFTAGRYHSLTVSPRGFPRELRVSARTSDGVIMSVRHVERPVVGIQFHPEYTRRMVLESAEAFGHEWVPSTYVAGRKAIEEKTPPDRSCGKR